MRNLAGVTIFRTFNKIYSARAVYSLSKEHKCLLNTMDPVGHSNWLVHGMLVNWHVHV